ncbi:heterokaryon incompatibility protein-domain-containing protein [Xylariaceae sp. FL0594]|nr:heterokaryon incompatibility protein-domain-containing protein [Xylariaceae sp. FL0594]
MENSINAHISPPTKKRDLSGNTPDRTDGPQPGISSKRPRTATKRIRVASPVRPMLSTLPPDESICEDCYKLDIPGLIGKGNQLKAAGKLKHLYQGGLLVADVGHRYRKPRNTTCNLCQILEALVQKKNYPGSEYEGDEIRAIPYLHRLHLERMSSDKVRDENIPLCLIVAPRNFNFSWGTEPRNLESLEHLTSTGYAVTMQDRDHSSPFAPQIVPPLFNPGTAKHWLGYCKDHHRSPCNLETTPVCGLQLIDCKTLSVEGGDTGIPYITLSYVWGGNQQTAGGMVRYVEGRRLLPEQLPAVIRDSIDVTLALGYRYLWVDKFCIDQNNPDVKHNQIQQMGAIYRNSELTLVAAAGVDEDHGLPGVGTKLRSRQLIAKVHDIAVIWTKDPHKSIASSRWFSRGWTFQESFLSRRRLVFTDDQVYFECYNMNCFESIYFPLDSFHIKNKSKTYETIRGGMFGRNRFKSYGKAVRNPHDAFAQYLSNVEEYSARKLTYDTDSLNAFHGVIQHSLIGYGLRNLWGLMFWPDNLDSFINSLTWWHKDIFRIQRRQAFPSWTWAGWEGPIEYRTSSATFKSFRNQIRHLKFETADGNTVEFQAGLPFLSQENCTYTTLHIMGAVVPSTSITYPPTKDPNRPWLIKSQFSTPTFDNYAGSDAGLVESSKEIQNNQYVHLGLMFGESVIMVLKPSTKDDAWERVGMLHVTNYFININTTDLLWKSFKIV